MKYTFIVAAAGVGKRMGLGYPKQFLEWEGKPIFIHTLEKIEKNPLVTDIVVVTGEEYIGSVEDYCRKYTIGKLKCVVAGGKERQDSIYNALQECRGSDFIGVQDGVRPFIEDGFIEASLDLLKSRDDIQGTVTGVPVKDTIKVVEEDGIIVSTPQRSTLVAAQTPQVFRGEVLIEAYERARSEGYLGTDDSSLVEYIGKRVKIIPGSYGNIKITTKEDLKYL